MHRFTRRWQGCHWREACLHMLMHSNRTSNISPKNISCDTTIRRSCVTPALQKREDGMRHVFYDNLLHDATWPDPLYTAAQSRTNYRDRLLHWLLALPGISNCTIEPDQLHVLYRVVVGYFFGAVLHILCYAVCEAVSLRTCMLYGHR